MRNCLDLTMPLFMQSATGLKHIELIRLDLAFRGVSLFIPVWHRHSQYIACTSDSFHLTCLRQPLTDMTVAKKTK